MIKFNSSLNRISSDNWSYEKIVCIEQCDYCNIDITDINITTLLKGA